jgi:hypothetical protein
MEKEKRSERRLEESKANDLLKAICLTIVVG